MFYDSQLPRTVYRNAYFYFRITNTPENSLMGKLATKNNISSKPEDILESVAVTSYSCVPYHYRKISGRQYLAASWW